MLQCTIARQTCNILSILLQLDARGAGARPRLRAGTIVRLVARTGHQ
jgi:hypothetical protein